MAAQNLRQASSPGLFPPKSGIAAIRKSRPKAEKSALERKSKRKYSMPQDKSIAAGRPSAGCAPAPDFANNSKIGEKSCGKFKGDRL